MTEEAVPPLPDFTEDEATIPADEVEDEDEPMEADDETRTVPEPPPEED